MSLGYIELPVQADATIIVEEAFDSLSADLGGWVPREGNLEVLLLELFANAAAQAATVASDVPASIFTRYGALVGINPLPGVPATILTTWTLTTPAGIGGYQISAGTGVGFYYQGVAYQFVTVDNINFSAGQTSSTGVVVQAVEPGSQYNIYTLGFNPVGLYLDLLNSDPNVANVEVTATYATDPSALEQGTDPETNADYLNRLSAELQLLAPRPISPSDFAQLAQNVVGVDRALVLDTFDPYTNILLEAIANLTTATVDTAWQVIGNGTGANEPTIALASNSLEVTTASTAIPSASDIAAATAVGATTMSVVGTSIDSSASTSYVVPVLIADTGASEIALVDGVSGSGPQTLTFVTPLLYAHTTSGTVTVLQGVSVGAPATPTLTGLFANQPWYQLGAVLQSAAGGETAAIPYLAALVTYDDGSQAVFSSLLPDIASVPDVPAVPKLVTANLTANNTAVLAPGAEAVYGELYNDITAQITSVVPYFLWFGAGTSKVHQILYSSLALAPFDFSVTDAPESGACAYNWVPDATLTAFGYPSATGATTTLAPWSLAAGLTPLPDWGIQYQAQSGSALGSPLAAESMIFELNASEGTYTFIAYVDASQVLGGTYDYISLEVIEPGGGAIGGPISPASATAGYVSFQFSPGACVNVQVKIIFGAGLTLSTGASVIVSQIQCLTGARSAPFPTAAPGYAWTPGGLFTPNAYTAPRSVAIAPVDPNGNNIAKQVAANLEAYLEAHREMNFLVGTITANYVPVNVLWSVVAQPGYNVATVQSAIQAALYAFLSPALWGGGTNTPPSWSGVQNVVRLLDVAGVIASTQGVANVVSVALGTYDGGFSTDDVVLGGLAPLPIGNNISGAVA